MVLGTRKSTKRLKHSDGHQQSHGPDDNTALPPLEKIAVEDVKVIDKHREVDPERVKSLAASMSTKIGLRTPITVRRIKEGFGTTTLALVAGVHRLEAAKTLGWKHIEAFIMKGTKKTDARMWQLMENLYRAELTPLQRAEHVAELVQLVKDGEKGAQVAHPGGQQPHDRGISQAAKILGFTREEVRRSLAIAGISEKAKQKAKKKGLDKNQSALLKIADEKASKAQLAMIDSITTSKPRSAPERPTPGRGKQKIKESIGPAPAVKAPSESDAATGEDPSGPPLVPEEDFPDLPASLDRRDENERLFDSLKAAWDKAPQSVRKRFVTEVLGKDIEV
jgi:ParB-like chromosome segregation protein Spo0J